MNITCNLDQLGDVIAQLVAQGLTFTASVELDGKVTVTLTGGY